MTISTTTLYLSNLDPSWNAIFQRIPAKIYTDLDEAITTDEEKYRDALQILPPRELRLSAFNFFNLDDAKIVILGQDPYIQPGQAMGMSFSVPDGVKIPPSLQNMYKELANDIEGFTMPTTGNLTKWAEQGVLLINAAWTVVERISNSHKRMWLPFINEFLAELSIARPDLIYILMGNDAKAKRAFIKSGVFIETAHPSPLARGAFFGSLPFSRANAELEKLGKTAIDWQI